MIAKIVVRTIPALDKAYDYLVPLNFKIKKGQRVIVPFGKVKKEGIVVDLVSSSPFSDLKKVHSIMETEPLLTEELIEMAYWMHKRYLSPLGACVFAMIPAGMDLVCTRYYFLTSNIDWDDSIRDRDPALFLATDLDSIYEEVSRGSTLFDYDLDIIGRLLALDLICFKEHWHQKGVKPKTRKGYVLKNPIGATTPKQKKVVEVLESGALLQEEILTKANVSVAVLKSLREKNVIKELAMPVRRNPLDSRETSRSFALSLNPEQKKILLDLLEEPNKSRENQKNTYLIFGITGSGKTEIYLQAIADCLKKGKKALVLVPEIALTTQMVDRFVSRFGSQVAVLHSALGKGERYDEWQRVKNDEANVVVGARSAVFAPLDNIGIIVLDEEHEDSYQQDDKLPYYHARDLAQFRARWHGVKLVLGSATPSLDSYKRALDGEYGLGVLRKRATKQTLPKVHIVDMREELKSGNRTIFSNKLRDALEDHLKSGRQAILFLNRRGFSSFVLCRECGMVLSCPNCDVSLTYHLKNNKLTCHYCNYQTSPPKKCPVCRSPYIKHFGIGTERIETEILALFPGVKTLRMDIDTTRRKNAHQKLLDKFKKHEADVLIGTQMVAKGLDIPNVTLVGVVTADTSLNIGDFRAYEKTFQLLTQVSGRAGRGEFPGEVVVQTYTPEHYAIRYAKDHDYLRFFEKENQFRLKASYPPYSHFAQVLFEGEDEKRVNTALLECNRIFGTSLSKDIKVIRCGSAPIKKIKRMYRYNILLRSYSWDGLAGFLREKNSDIMGIGRKNRVRVLIRIDPSSVL
ncbi:MAG: primosomal protein N' [Firmicutes bacterium]|nr:primosomal protein N' [Bacillota bacterium]